MGMGATMGLLGLSGVAATPPLDSLPATIPTDVCRNNHNHNNKNYLPTPQEEKTQIFVLLILSKVSSK